MSEEDKIVDGKLISKAKDLYDSMMGTNLNDPKVRSIDKFYAQQFQSRINPNTPYESFAKFLKSNEGKDYLEGKDYIERSN